MNDDTMNDDFFFEYEMDVRDEEMEEPLGDECVEVPQYHTRDEVIDGMCNMLDEMTERISRFEVAKDRYNQGDLVGYLKKINGEEIWDMLVDDKTPVVKAALESYAMQTMLAKHDREIAFILRNLMSSDTFISSQIDSNEDKMLIAIVRVLRQYKTAKHYE